MGIDGNFRNLCLNQFGMKNSWNLVSLWSWCLFMVLKISLSHYIQHAVSKLSNLGPTWSSGQNVCKQWPWFQAAHQILSFPIGAYEHKVFLSGSIPLSLIRIWKILKNSWEIFWCWFTLRPTLLSCILQYKGEALCT